MKIKEFIIYTLAGVLYIAASVVMAIIILAILISIPGAIFFGWSIDWWLFSFCLIWALGSFVPYSLSRKKILSKLKKAWSFKVVYYNEKCGSRDDSI